VHYRLQRSRDGSVEAEIVAARIPADSLFLGGDASPTEDLVEVSLS
jgi:hypothetical protein